MIMHLVRYFLIFILASYLLACSPTTTTPTPTPPFGLPPLQLPQDESPHDYLAEWWYFNAHLETEEKEKFSLHDVVFQIQEPASKRNIYVRQIGLSTPNNQYVTSERMRSVSSILPSESGDFDLIIGTSKMQGIQGENYFLSANVKNYHYELQLTSTTKPLVHGGGLLDYKEAGITYYYTRPRLNITGIITTPLDKKIPVKGLGWMDKQWGDFQPVSVEWDWASIQLDDGTDLMISMLYDRKGTPVENYATLRRKGKPSQFLTRNQFTFKPQPPKWKSPHTGTYYRTSWRLTIPTESVDLILQSQNSISEFSGQLLPVAYWESAVKVTNAQNGEPEGQGFIELNWAQGRDR